MSSRSDRGRITDYLALISDVAAFGLSRDGSEGWSAVLRAVDIAGGNPADVQTVTTPAQGFETLEVAAWAYVVKVCMLPERRHQLIGALRARVEQDPRARSILPYWNGIDPEANSARIGDRGRDAIAAELGVTELVGRALADSDPKALLRAVAMLTRLDTVTKGQAASIPSREARDILALLLKSNVPPGIREILSEAALVQMCRHWANKHPEDAEYAREGSWWMFVPGSKLFSKWIVDYRPGTKLERLATTEEGWLLPELETYLWDLPTTQRAIAESVD